MGSRHSNKLTIEKEFDDSRVKSLSNIDRSEYDDNEHDLLMDIDNISDISGLSDHSYQNQLGKTLIAQLSVEPEKVDTSTRTPNRYNIPKGLTISVEDDSNNLDLSAKQNLCDVSADDKKPGTSTTPRSL